MANPNTLIDPADHFQLKQGDYKVCKHRGVWSNLSKKFLKPNANIVGYIPLRLKKIDGTTLSVYEHIVVKESFDGKTPEKYVIDHINRIKNDNKLENLRFATRAENNINRDTVKYNVEEVMESEHEEWKPFENVFISNQGKIKKKTGQITYGCKKLDGYCSITINKKTYQVHRLVCELFNGKPDSNDMQVNHKDKNRSNNNFNNLEWTTRNENMIHAKKNMILQYNLNEELLNTFDNIKHASKETGMSIKQISYSCKNIKHGIFVFKYKDAIKTNYPCGRCCKFSKFKL